MLKLVVRFGKSLIFFLLDMCVLMNGKEMFYEIMELLKYVRYYIYLEYYIV